MAIRGDGLTIDVAGPFLHQAGEPPGHRVPFVAISFDVDGDVADAWADALLSHGALSVDATDPAAGTDAEVPLFDEPGQALARWQQMRLTALAGDAIVASEMVARAATEIGVPAPDYATTAVPEQDWVRATQSQFGPISVGGRIWIVPSWSTSVALPGVRIVLDPGLAFGTGSHPTTRLCLEWLAAELRTGQAVLDYGCGSGILAIAAAKLGAGRVVGTDIDPQAVVASRENARRNDVTISFVATDALPEGRAFDVVVANILANPLRLLAPALAARVAPGGRIVLSGVLAEQASDVLSAYRDWFRIRVWKDEDGWVALVGERVESASITFPSVP